MRILLVEDNKDDAILFREMLNRAGSGKFRLHHVDSLQNALTHISACDDASDNASDDASHVPDAIVLDLDLPDSEGLDTFVDVHRAAPRIPIVVISGRQEEALALNAVQRGAQDYLVKDHLQEHLLKRCLQYAVERGRRLLEKEIQHARELDLLESYSPQTNVTTRMYSVRPLKEQRQDLYDEVIAEYEQLIRLSLEQRMFKVDHPLSERLATLGDILGRLNVVPSDVVDVHRAALSIVTQDVPQQKRQAYEEEARLLLLGLMAKLAAHYRSRSEAGAEISR